MDLLKRAPSIGKKNYPAIKQIIWKQCKGLVESRFFLLLQLNNLSVKEIANLRHELRTRFNLHLRFPKPSIMRAFLKSVPQFRPLGEAVVGPTFCGISNTCPADVKGGLEYLSREKRAVVAGGMVEGTTLLGGLHGLKSAVEQLASREESMSRLLQQLNAAGTDMAGAIESPSQAISQIGQIHCLLHK